MSAVSKEVESLKEALTLKNHPYCYPIVTSINLRGHENEIGQAGAVSLAEILKINKTITAVNLKRNRIGDKGMRVLSEAFKLTTTLTFLNVAGKRVIDSCVKTLAWA